MNIKIILGAAAVAAAAFFGWKQFKSPAPNTTEAAKAANEKTAEPVVNGNTVTLAQTSAAIRTAKVEAGANQVLGLPGRLTWNEEHTARVTVPLQGKIVRLLAQTGDTVKQGQPLAELASPDFGQAQAEARKSSADVLLARQNAERTRELHAAGVAALKDYQAAQAEYARAKAESDRTQARLAQLGGSGSAGSFVLRSPLAGTVVERNANVGQELRNESGQPAFVVSDPRELWLYLDASENDLTRLPKGASFKFSTKAYGTRLFDGRVVNVAETIDPQSRTLKLRALVPNDDRALKAEMFVQAKLPGAADTTGDAERIASSALLLEGERYFAFVQTAPNQFERRAVKVLGEGDGVSRVSGLKVGDNVVTTGNLYLQTLVVAAQAAQTKSGGGKPDAEKK